MKKLLAVTALFAAFSFTSVDAKSLDFSAEELPQYTQCELNAISYGEFMDGHNGRSGAYYAMEFANTFCN